jgi:hypothetical protein
MLLAQSSLEQLPLAQKLLHLVKREDTHQFQVVLVFFDDSPFSLDVSDLGFLAFEGSFHLKVVLVSHDGCAVAARQGCGLSTTFEFTFDLKR